jgi:hypothetical protein
MSMNAAEYPEHAKLAEISAQSQAIGEFLDFGLPRLGGGMTLYEYVTYDCECNWCERREARRSSWHTLGEKDAAVDGVVQIKEWQPTLRTIKSILAEYFQIDQAKIDDEKAAMLTALRDGS